MEVQYSKNYLKNILPQEAGKFRNNIEKKPQKPHPKSKKYLCYILQIIFVLSAIQCTR